MSENKISILSETFENERTGEQVEGVTIMIDGKLKDMLDIIIQNENQDPNDYKGVMRDIVFAGISQFIGKYKKDPPHSPRRGSTR